MPAAFQNLHAHYNFTPYTAKFTFHTLHTPPTSRHTPHSKLQTRHSTFQPPRSTPLHILRSGLHTASHSITAIHSAVPCRLHTALSTHIHTPHFVHFCTLCNSLDHADSTGPILITLQTLPYPTPYTLNTFNTSFTLYTATLALHILHDSTRSRVHTHTEKRCKMVVQGQKTGAR